MPSKRVKQIINGAAWAGFCICGLWLGMSISASFRTGNVIYIFAFIISGIGAIISIRFFKYNKESKECQK